MERELKIPWRTGTGHIVIREDAAGGVTIGSDTYNSRVARSQTIRFHTLTGDSAAEIVVLQEGVKVMLRDRTDKKLRDCDGLTLTAWKQ